MNTQGIVGPSGRLHLDVARASPVPDTPQAIPWSSYPHALDAAGRPAWRNIYAHAWPHRWLPDEVREFRRANLPNVLRGLSRVARPRLGRGPLTGALWLDVKRAGGQTVHYGLVSLDLVVAAGCAHVVDAWQGITSIGDLRYHAVGTGTAPPNVLDTTLGSEATTALSPNSTRGVGTLGEVPAQPTQFRTVGTVAFDGLIAMTEWGLCSTPTAGTGTLFDRATFFVVSLDAGDTATWTFDVVVLPGG